MNEQQIAEIEHWCTDYYIFTSSESQKNAQIKLDELSQHPDV
jgi:hypothetical protein